METINRQIDSQWTDQWLDRQTGKKIGGQKDSQPDRQTGRQADGKINFQYDSKVVIFKIEQKSEGISKMEKLDGPKVLLNYKWGSCDLVFRTIYSTKTYGCCGVFINRGMEKRDTVLTNEQVNPVPVPGALSALQNADKPKRAKQGKRRKGDSILLQERNKVLKSSANHRQATSNRGTGAVKKESGKSDCTLKGVQDKPQTRSTSIEQLNFQDFPPLTWDIGNDFLTPIVSEDEHRAAASLVVKEEHQQLQPQTGTTPVKRATKQQEENFDERAPFIPLPDVDAALEMDDETLMDIPFLSSPFSWLTEEDIPVDKGRVTPTTSEQTTEMGPQNNAGYLMGKEAQGLLNSAGKCVPLVTQVDAEVNAPLEANYLLQGEDLLRALESGLLTYWSQQRVNHHCRETLCG